MNFDYEALLNPEVLTAAAGGLLSLLFLYTPRLKTWYNNQIRQTKALVMLGLLLLVTAAVTGLECALDGCDETIVNTALEAMFLASSSVAPKP